MWKKKWENCRFKFVKKKIIICLFIDQVWQITYFSPLSTLQSCYIAGEMSCHHMFDMSPESVSIAQMASREVSIARSRCTATFSHKRARAGDRTAWISVLRRVCSSTKLWPWRDGRDEPHVQPENLCLEQWLFHHAHAFLRELSCQCNFGPNDYAYICISMKLKCVLACSAVYSGSSQFCATCAVWSSIQCYSWCSDPSKRLHCGWSGMCLLVLSLKKNRYGIK